MKKLIKKLMFTLLPDRLLHALRKIHYARKLRSITENDEDDIKVVKHMVKPGACVLDIGANFGVYTKFLSEMVGPAGRVYSIEPMPPTFDILRTCVGKLGLKNVEAVNAAISDADGTVTMEVPRSASGGEDFYGARIVTGGTRGGLRNASVTARSLDSMFADGGGIGFIKCDVEGHELPCVRGAAALIDRCRPIWLLEIMGDPDQPGSDAAKTFDQLGWHGYEAWWFDGQTLRKRGKGERNDNYFFLTADHIRALQAQKFPVRDDDV